MAEATLVQEGMDRVESAVKSLDKEFQKIQKDWTKRRRSFDKRRRSFEKDAQKRVDRLVADVRKSSLAQRAEDLRKQARKSLDSQVETVLGGLQIASRRDVARIDRKLAQLNKKLREFEKVRSNGSAS